MLASDENCQFGGEKITRGVDDNNNGILEKTEVDETIYNCNSNPEEVVLASMESIQFGNVSVGSSVERATTFRNIQESSEILNKGVAKSNEQITAVSVYGESFSLVSSNCENLAPNEECNIVVEFKPKKEGAYKGVIVIKKGENLERAVISGVSGNYNSIDLSFENPDENIIEGSDGKFYTLDKLDNNTLDNMTDLNDNATGDNATGQINLVLWLIDEVSGLVKEIMPTGNAPEKSARGPLIIDNNYVFLKSLNKYYTLNPVTAKFDNKSLTNTPDLTNSRNIVATVKDKLYVFLTKDNLTEVYTTDFVTNSWNKVDGASLDNNSNIMLYSSLLSDDYNIYLSYISKKFTSEIYKYNIAEKKFTKHGTNLPAYNLTQKAINGKFYGYGFGPTMYERTFIEITPTSDNFTTKVLFDIPDVNYFWQQQYAVMGDKIHVYTENGAIVYDTITGTKSEIIDDIPSLGFYTVKAMNKVYEIKSTYNLGANGMLYSYPELYQFNSAKGTSEKVKVISDPNDNVTNILMYPMLSLADNATKIYMPRTDFVFDTITRELSKLDSTGDKPDMYANYVSNFTSGDNIIQSYYDNFSKFHKYDTKTNSWSALPSTEIAPQARPMHYNGNMPQIANNVYLFAGSNMPGMAMYNNCLFDFWVYDIKAHSWKDISSKLPDSFKDRVSIQSYVMNNKLYLGNGDKVIPHESAPGFYITVETYNDLWEFDPSTEEFKLIKEDNISFVSGFAADNKSVWRGTNVMFP